MTAFSSLQALPQRLFSLLMENDDDNGSLDVALVKLLACFFLVAPCVALIVYLNCHFVSKRGGGSTRTNDNATASNRARALCEAAKDGDLTRMQHLVLVDKVDVTVAGGAFGETALHQVCYHHEHFVQGTNDGVSLARWLCENGAHVNAKNENGYTPLHYAVFKCPALSLSSSHQSSLDLIRFLLQHGADTSIANFEGTTPMDMARKQKIVSVIELLSKYHNEKNNKEPALVPHDAFLIHAGPQKAGPVETLRFFLEFPSSRPNHNQWQCFLDRDMSNHHHPTATMERHLEMCRHCILVVSQAFLTRPDPCAELQYAFAKHLWLQQSQGWHSLWVVLYDVSVEEYKCAYEASGRQLPPLHNHVQMYVYQLGRGQYPSWVDLCQRLAQHVQTYDDQASAPARWRQWLQEYHNHHEDEGNEANHSLADFPRAQSVYEIPACETGCVDKNFFDKTSMSRSS